MLSFQMASPAFCLLLSHVGLSSIQNYHHFQIIHNYHGRSSLDNHAQLSAETRRSTVGISHEGYWYDSRRQLEIC